MAEVRLINNLKGILYFLDTPLMDFEIKDRELIKATIVEDIKTKYDIAENETIEELIEKLTNEMLTAASNMEFEKAAELRDKIRELQDVI